MPPGAQAAGRTSMKLFGVWRHLQGPPQWQESTGRTDHEGPGSSGQPQGGVRFEGYAAEVLPPLSPGKGGPVWRPFEFCSETAWFPSGLPSAGDSGTSSCIDVSG